MPAAKRNHSNRGSTANVARRARSATAGPSVVLQPTAARQKVESLAIPVPPRTLKALSERRAKVKSLVKAFGLSIERSRKSGRSSAFLVEVDAKGNPTISPFNGQGGGLAQTSSGAGRLEHALVAARRRGRLRAVEILGGKEMLTADEFASRLGVSRVTVNARRQKHELLALDGAKRGFRFPEWQVDDDGKPLDVLPRLFELLGEDPWTVYRFLVQRHAALDGMTAKDALLRGEEKEVLEAAEGVAQGAAA
jgi:hypothetical protein